MTNEPKNIPTIPTTIYVDGTCIDRIINRYTVEVEICKSPTVVVHLDVAYAITAGEVVLKSLGSLTPDLEDAFERILNTLYMEKEGNEG